MSTRVLLVGAHPDDEDTFLIAWLSRGRHVETAYLSLTRGDGGQNLIGNELGEALGVVRTEELIAARRIDGAKQFFTRAYDFGFSKDTADTYRHWPKDSLLGDVVRVVRAFRPHVIVGVFSGTPRDGHGQHQVSGLLAREAYDLASDTTRFPVASHGGAWTPLKLYRAARFSASNGTLAYDAGEYSPLLGRSYAEIAGESRSQHKSQGFGALQRRGPLTGYVRREASRVNEETPAASERTMFDGIDTTWSRLREHFRDEAERAALDSLPDALRTVQGAFAPLQPSGLLAPLGRVQRLVEAMCGNFVGGPCATLTLVDRPSRRRYAVPVNGDVQASVAVLRERLARAIRLAAGVEIDALASREVHPVGDSTPVIVTVHNRGSDTIAVTTSANPPRVNGAGVGATRIPPGAAFTDTMMVLVDSVAQPWWLRAPRRGAFFTMPASTVSETHLEPSPTVAVTLNVPGLEPLEIGEPVVFRYADEVKGEQRPLLAGTPSLTLSLSEDVQYARADVLFERLLDVSITSADDRPREARVSLRVPSGLRADSAAQTLRLGARGDDQTVTFRLRGRLPAGPHRIEATVESDGESYGRGYDVIEYDHIRRQRLYRSAATTISVVDVVVPRSLRVAYVKGVSDNVAPMLAQLGIAVTELSPRDLARADLSRFTALVVGPRAYDAHPELAAARTRLLDFARAGGTLVVQYGQYEMMQPGIMPHPVAINRPHDRVTLEDAPVTLLDPTARELRTPNRIGASDFAGWVQERALYMPRTFDSRYRALLAMHDPGEAPNRGAILVTRLGRGTYVYTTLAFFRQLPAGVPGAARLFVNLLSAGMTPGAAP